MATVVSTSVSSYRENLPAIRFLTKQEIIARSRQGVLRAEADRVAIGLSTSYLHRLKIDQRISQDASERLLLLDNLRQHARDTFEQRSTTVLG